MNVEELMETYQISRKPAEIWHAIEKCFPIEDTIWYNDYTTLLEHITHIVEEEE